MKPASGELRLRQDVASKDKVNFARLLNHEAVHAGQLAPYLPETAAATVLVINFFAAPEKLATKSLRLVILCLRLDCFFLKCRLKKVTAVE